MNHEQVRDLLSDYIEGHLPDALVFPVDVQVEELTGEPAGRDDARCLSDRDRVLFDLQVERH